MIRDLEKPKCKNSATMGASRRIYRICEKESVERYILHNLITITFKDIFTKENRVFIISGFFIVYLNTNHKDHGKVGVVCFEYPIFVLRIVER